jgi:ribulose-5-phosphate 4-epimerase/fuculose-1-phosphate aldolase
LAYGFGLSIKSLCNDSNSFPELPVFAKSDRQPAASQSDQMISATGECAMGHFRLKFIRLLVGLTLLLSGLAEAQTPQPAPEPEHAHLIEDLVAANRILADQQVLDAFGHVSVRHPSNPDHFLMSRSLAPALVTAADIVEYDLDGRAVGAPANFTHFLERFIHAEIYRKRPDINAVVHSHSPAVIPFGASKIELRPIYHMSAFLAPGVPVFEIREAAGGATNMLVSNATLGKALAETLGDKNVALMRGHGDVVVASTLPMAVFRAVYTETNARLQLQAKSLGGEVIFLDREEGEKAMKVLDQIHLRAWDLWKRKVAR